MGQICVFSGICWSFLRSGINFTNINQQSHKFDENFSL